MNRIVRNFVPTPEGGNPYRCVYYIPAVNSYNVAHGGKYYGKRETLGEAMTLRDAAERGEVEAAY